MYCIKCGGKIENGKKFCTKCGNAVKNIQQPVQKISPVKIKNIHWKEPKVEGWRYKGNKVHKARTVVISILVCLMLIGASFIIYHYSASQHKAGENNVYTVKKQENERGSDPKFLALVRNEEGKYGYIDATGTEKIECRFNDAKSFSENGIAAVCEEIMVNGEVAKKWGLINAGGEEIIAPEYDDVSKYGFSENGLLSVAREISIGENVYYAWGCVNAEGQEVIECQYVNLDNFFFDELYWNKDGLSAVSRYMGNDEDGDKIYKYGVIDETGKEIIPLEYDDMSGWLTNDSLIAVGRQDTTNEDNTKWGYINVDNQEIFPFVYDEAYNFSSDGLGLTIVAKKVGKEMQEAYIDKTGKIVIPNQYSWGNVSEFSGCGLAVAKRDSCGYIDTSGKCVIPMQYGWGEPFSKSGYAVVGKMMDKDSEGKEIYKSIVIDTKGKEILSYGYDTITNYYDDQGVFMVKDYGKYGLANEQGEIILENKFDEIKLGIKRFDGEKTYIDNDHDWWLLETKTGQVDENTSACRCVYINKECKQILELPQKYISADVFVKVA